MELSEFKANEGKQVNIQVGDRTFARHAIATHFVQVGESYMDLIQKYVVPIYQEGDILSSSEKIISLCQKRIVRKSDMKLSWLAKFLSKFASHSSAGIGVDSPWKMQFAIDQRGALYVIWAAICAGFGRRWPGWTASTTIALTCMASLASAFRRTLTECARRFTGRQASV